MRLFHLTSHHEALRIIAEGFYGAESPEPVCYLLLDSLDVHSPLEYLPFPVAIWVGRAPAGVDTKDLQ